MTNSGASSEGFTEVTYDLDLEKHIVVPQDLEEHRGVVYYIEKSRKSIPERDSNEPKCFDVACYREFPKSDLTLRS